MKTIKVLVIGALLAAGLAGAVLGLRVAYAHVAAAYWRSRLEAAAENDTADVIEEAAKSGNPGMGVAIETLGSPRELLSNAALEALRRRLAEWQESPSDANVRRQAQLARALAEQAPGFGPGGRQRAARLAGRILLWLPPELPVDRATVIADCDRVLAAAKSGFNASVPTTGELVASKTNRSQSDEPPSPFELATAPGRGWTPEPLTPVPVAVQPEPRVAAGPTDEPKPAARRLPPPPDEASAEPDLAEAAPPALIPPKTAEKPSDEPPSALPLPPEIHREAVPIPIEDLRTLETVDVMRKLREPGSAGAAARTELVRRGFTPVHLELAGRLFSPDPQARAELVRLLPRLESADPDPWLWQLAQDPEVRIRGAAIAALATGGDTAVLDRLEELARGDPDPQIRQQAAQIARIRERRMR